MFLVCLWPCKLTQQANGNKFMKQQKIHHFNGQLPTPTVFKQDNTKKNAAVLKLVLYLRGTSLIIKLNSIIKLNLKEKKTFSRYAASLQVQPLSEQMFPKLLQLQEVKRAMNLSIGHIDSPLKHL